MLRQFIKRLLIRKLDSVPGTIVQRFASGKINCEVKINQENESLELHSEGDGGKKIEFPFVYLRDNCQCDQCYHAQSSSRILNWEHFDASVKPKEFQFDNDSKELKVTWNDSSLHTSVFDYEWLQARNFADDNRENYLQKFYRPEKRLWSKDDYKDVLQYFDFKKIIESDQELHDWLECLTVNGVAMIENTPQTESEARKIANRVGFIRKTHYGEEFIVKAKEDTSNVAYLSAPLQIHTDLPYYDFAPGVNLLHCLVQSKSNGAQNQLCDGFYVAKVMEEKFPEEFKSLSSVLVNWFDIGQEETGPPFHSIYRAPMFCLDYENKIERVNHSIPQRDSFFSVPLQEVRGWYKALKLFVDLIHQESVEFKTVEGTILCFDNSRLVHGRKKYKDVDGNYRHIVGAYLDWDEIFSRLRVLQKQLNTV